MVPGITHLFVKNYMEQCLKIFIINARTQIYNPICSIDEYEKQQSSYFDNVSNSRDNAIPSNLTT